MYRGILNVTSSEVHSYTLKNGLKTHTSLYSFETKGFTEQKQITENRKTVSVSIESTCLTAQSTSLTSALYIAMWTPLSHWENIHVLFCVFCGSMLPLGSYFVGVSRILWAEIGGNSCESGGLQWLSWVCIMFVCCVVEFWVDSQTDRDGLKLLHVTLRQREVFFFSLSFKQWHSDYPAWQSTMPFLKKM